MKDQYVGDINDYRKYALLRGLAGQGDIKIGVCWMLTPPDGRPDGRMIEYLNRPERWRAYDPSLFGLLQSVINEPDQRRLAHIEQSGILPGARYFNDITPDDAAGRDSFFRRATAELARCDLIFFDPDNGLDVPSRRKGQKDSSKYVFRDEVAAAFAGGQSVLIYQHFAREERRSFVERISRSLCEHMPGAEIWAFRTAHVVFFLVVHPRHADVLARRISEFASRSGDLFAAIERVSPPVPQEARHEG